MVWVGAFCGGDFFEVKAFYAVVLGKHHGSFS